MSSRIEITTTGEPHDADIAGRNLKKDEARAGEMSSGPSFRM